MDDVEVVNAKEVSFASYYKKVLTKDQRDALALLCAAALELADDDAHPNAEYILESPEPNPFYEARAMGTDDMSVLAQNNITGVLGLDAELWYKNLYKERNGYDEAQLKRALDPRAKIYGQVVLDLLESTMPGLEWSTQPQRELDIQNFKAHPDVEFNNPDGGQPLVFELKTLWADSQNEPSGMFLRQSFLVQSLLQALSRRGLPMLGIVRIPYQELPLVVYARLYRPNMHAERIMNFVATRGGNQLVVLGPTTAQQQGWPSRGEAVAFLDELFADRAQAVLAFNRSPLLLAPERSRERDIVKLRGELQKLAGL